MVSTNFEINPETRSLLDVLGKVTAVSPIRVKKKPKKKPKKRDRRKKRPPGRPRKNHKKKRKKRRLRRNPRLLSRKIIFDHFGIKDPFIKKYLLRVNRLQFSGGGIQRKKVYLRQWESKRLIKACSTYLATKARSPIGDDVATYGHPVPRRYKNLPKLPKLSRDK